PLHQLLGVFSAGRGMRYTFLVLPGAAVQQSQKIIWLCEIKKETGSRSGCLDYLKKLIGLNSHFLSTGILYLIRILKWIFSQYENVTGFRFIPIARLACSRAICGLPYT